MESTATPMGDRPGPGHGTTSLSFPPSVPGEADERVERLLRDAHLSRMRDQWVHAEALCREALSISPGDASGLEMLGDLLTAKGDLTGSEEQYRRALEVAPTKPSLEEKIARIALRKDEDERERLAMQLMLTTPRSKDGAKRSVMVATMLSLICAGAGQLFNRQFVKGGVLLGLWLICLAIGWQDMFKFTLGITGLLPRAERVNDVMAMVGFVGLAIWVYGLLDAASQAGKVNRELDL